MVFDIPTDAYRVLITGDRDWTDRETMRAELASLPTHSIIIHGCARGADLLAEEIATALGLPTIPVPAHWSCNTPAWRIVHGDCPVDCTEISGGAAGPIRNLFMLDTYLPDYLLGFHMDIDHSRGTKHCLNAGRKRKVSGKLVGSNGIIIERW
jgi:SLOG family YspA-like protein